MKKNIKIAITVSGLAIALTTFFLIRKKVKNNSYNKPCKGKRCADGIVGRTISFSDDRANIRNSAVVDGSDNLIGTVTTNPIGVVTSQTLGGDGYVWYKVRLDEELNGREVGFVREDVITIK